MKKLLFINGCIRGDESRTLALAEAFLKRFLETHPDYETETADIDALGLLPLTKKTLERRNAAGGDFSGGEFTEAKRFKNADMLLIAAPFWEGTFPAAVHTYIEQVCVAGLTFRMSETGYEGLCRAEKAVFVTTRGGIYEEGDYAHDKHAEAFLRSVLKMLGVRELLAVAAEGLDIDGMDVDARMQSAKEKLFAIAKEL